jgi:ABC-type multidrug transport system fused ATPase/permease subunit
LNKGAASRSTSIRSRAVEIAQLAGAHAWSFPLITIFGVLSSLAESFGVGLIILFLYTVLGRQGDAASAGGFLGSLFAHLSAHVHNTTLLAALILAAITAKAAFTAIYSAISAHVQNLLGRDLRDRMHRQYLEVNYSYIRQREEGELYRMLATESWIVAEAYKSISNIAINAGAMAVMMALLLLISWPLTLMMLAGGAILCLALNRVSRFARQLGREAMENAERLAVRMLQTLQGMRAIRAFGQEVYYQQAFEEASEDTRRVVNKTTFLSALLGPVSDSTYLLLIGGILMLTSRLSIPTATILTCVILLYRAQLPFRELQSAIFALAEKEAVVSEAADLLRRSDKYYPPLGHRPFHGLKDGIEFRDVEFSYAPSAGNVLDKASFRIPAGRTTVLMGASGAGKTTIVNVLLRLDEPSNGQILADGVPLAEIRRDHWLKRLAAAGQDIELIDSTIDANIRIARAEASAQAVREAAALAGFLDVVEAFPDGMQHWIGAQGANLSGGQRQRLGLARAILRDPDILILDEATSALDSAVEHSVQANLQTMFRNRTVIMITHRMSAVLAADHLVCIENGRVTAEGAPRDLLSKGALDPDHSSFTDHKPGHATIYAIGERRQAEAGKQTPH